MYNLPLPCGYSPPERNPTFLLTQKCDQMYKRKDTLYPYSIHLITCILLLYNIYLFTSEYFTD